MLVVVDEAQWPHEGLVWAGFIRKLFIKLGDELWTTVEIGERLPRRLLVPLVGVGEQYSVL
jgi:hypothetical protein